MSMRTLKITCKEVQIIFSSHITRKNRKFDVILKYYPERKLTLCDQTKLANLGPCVNKECPFNAESEDVSKINVLPYIFEQDGREELLLTFRSKEDAEIVQEFLENKAINMMWIEPQNSLGSHALRIEAKQK